MRPELLPRPFHNARRDAKLLGDIGDDARPQTPRTSNSNSQQAGWRAIIVYALIEAHRILDVLEETVATPRPLLVLGRDPGPAFGYRHPRRLLPIFRRLLRSCRYRSISLRRYLGAPAAFALAADKQTLEP
jgi:hypothetical protein